MTKSYLFVVRLVMLTGITMLLNIFSVYAEGDGYGENPGGAGGDTIIVDNAQDFKSYAGAVEPYVILIKDTIDVGSEVSVRSYKTISGINTCSTILGRIRIASGAHDVVIKNLNITNPNEDGITIRNAKYVFVTNCTIYDCADGCIDVTVESDFVTISSCRFYYEKVTFHKFVNLIGASDDNITDRGKLHVTFHNNWWDRGCTSRMPRVRFGSVHIYNNYFSCSGNNYCSRSGKEGSIFSEYNYYNGTRDPLSVEGGWAKSIGNEYVNCEGTIYAGNDDVFVPTYSYSTVAPEAAKNDITINAGNTNNTPNKKQLKKATKIEWSDQEMILLGTPLSDQQLNAVATGNTGEPVYTPAVGTVLSEGFHTITVTFPENENYLAASKTVNIHVKYDYRVLDIFSENMVGEGLIDVQPAGIIIAGQLSFPLNTEITLTANNNLFSTFDHWQNNDSKAITTFIIKNDTSVTAFYQPVTYIVGWDLYGSEPGNRNRVADFKSTEINNDAKLKLRDENGTEITWALFSEDRELYGKNAAMIRRSGADAGKYYFEINFNAQSFKNIRIEASMFGAHTHYKEQLVEYSIDGNSFDEIGVFYLEKTNTWYNGSFQLPELANGAEKVFVRFKGDASSGLIDDGIDGTAITDIKVLADTLETKVDKLTNIPKIINKEWYNLQGQMVKQPGNGIFIVRSEYANGSFKTEKILINKNF